MLFFNIDNGYLDGIVRGYKASLLTTQQYSLLSQCESLEDMRVQLASTDYAPYVQMDSQQREVTSSALYCRLVEFFRDQFEYLQNNATGMLVQFLDYIRYGYMIDNIILLVTGTLHERDVADLMRKCHPLGLFDGIEALTTSTNAEELYHTVLIATPLAEYFELCISAKDLNETNIEIIRNTLYKAYLEDFYLKFGNEVGSLIEFEADRRVIEIAVNSIGTDLDSNSKGKLFPRIGRFFSNPILREKLMHCSDLEDVKECLGSSQDYKDLDISATDSSLGDYLFAREVDLHRRSFLTQFGYNVFFSWCRLKEQEIRNIMWIAECIEQNQRQSISRYVPIF